MFISRKNLSRRAMLKASGVAIALPFLEAMRPACTALAAYPPLPTRMGFFYLPHGAVMDNTPHGAAADQWTPEADGKDFKLKPIMKPLEHLRDQLTIVSNLDNRPGSGTVHAINPATWLSSVRPQEGVEPAMAATIDQIAARHLGRDTMLPSIEVATEPPVVAGNCGGTFGCSYMTTLSFRSSTLPLPMEYNPRKLFIQLFGEGATDAERDALLAQQASILDMVRERAGALRAKLGHEDSVRMDDYLETVREIERRLAVLQSQKRQAMDIPEMPIGREENFDRQLRLMFDLIALAFQGDITRIATFLMAAEATNRTYSHIGVPDAFHPLSHHGNDLNKMDRLARIQRYHVEAFAEFIDKLKAMPEADGCVLDRTLVLYGSNMSNSDLHDNYPLPNLVVAGNDLVEGGRHLRPAARTPISNLHVALLSRAGVPVDGVGDSTGALTGI